MDDTLHLGKGVVHYNGAEATLLLGGIFAAVVGILSYHQMDDRKGVSLRKDLIAALRGRKSQER